MATKQTEIEQEKQSSMIQWAQANPLLWLHSQRTLHSFLDLWQLLARAIVKSNIFIYPAFI